MGDNSPRNSFRLVCRDALERCASLECMECVDTALRGRLDLSESFVAEVEKSAVSPGSDRRAVACSALGCAVCLFDGVRA